MLRWSKFLISCLWMFPTALAGLIILLVWRDRTWLKAGWHQHVIGRNGSWPQKGVLAWFLPPWAAAVTYGPIVFYRDTKNFVASYHHEKVHVRQGYFMGPLFFPLYLLGWALAIAFGGHGYYDNPAEAAARRRSGS